MALSFFRPPSKAGARTSTAPRCGRTRRLRPPRSTRAKEDEGQNLVVDPYAVAVEIRNGHVVPKALREAIRAAGPTVRRDLGKQAEGHAPLSGPTAVLEAEHVSL